MNRPRVAQVLGPTTFYPAAAVILVRVPAIVGCDISVRRTSSPVLGRCSGGEDTNKERTRAITIRIPVESEQPLAEKDIMAPSADQEGRPKEVCL